MIFFSEKIDLKYDMNQIYKENIEIQKKIDEGNFGSVFVGMWGGTKVFSLNKKSKKFFFPRLL